MSFAAPPPPQPLHRTAPPSVAQACARWAIFFGGMGLFAWFAVVHPMLTCLGLGAFAGLVCAIADSSPSSSAPVRSVPSSESELRRREREIASASATGLLGGLLLSFWFFCD